VFVRQMDAYPEIERQFIIDDFVMKWRDDE